MTSSVGRKVKHIERKAEKYGEKKVRLHSKHHESTAKKVMGRLKRVLKKNHLPTDGSTSNNKRPVKVPKASMKPVRRVIKKLKQENKGLNHPKVKAPTNTRARDQKRNASSTRANDSHTKKVLAREKKVEKKEEKLSLQ